MPESMRLIEAGFGHVITTWEMKPAMWIGNFESDQSLAKWLRLVKKDPTESEIVCRIVKRGNSSHVAIPYEIMKAMSLEPGDDILVRISKI